MKVGDLVTLSAYGQNLKRTSWSRKMMLVWCPKQEGHGVFQTVHCCTKYYGLKALIIVAGGNRKLLTVKILN